MWEALKMEFDGICTWSDYKLYCTTIVYTTIVFYNCISMDIGRSRQKMFISNRIAEIQLIVPSKY